MKLKELETQKKQEEAERKRIEREQKRVEKEQKKAEKEALKGQKNKGKRKGKKDATNRKGKGAEPVEKSEQSDCECPVCGIDFGNDEENVRWIGCDGCLRWWHVDCLDITEIPVDFFCSDCL